MNNYNYSKRTRPFTRIFSGFLIGILTINFVFPPSIASAQLVPFPMMKLPSVGSLVTISEIYTPLHLQGIVLDPTNPMQLRFIIDTGDSGLEGDPLKQEALKVIKYFFAALTVPQNEMWVNLSPYQSNTMIPETFGQTEMGRDMLAQDYILKQLTASLMFPDEKIGNEFWTRVYTRAQERFGTTQLPFNTFNKIWITPKSATIYENTHGALIKDETMQVMLERDYLALEQNTDNPKFASHTASTEQLNQTDDLTQQMVREVLIPEIEREVNEGKNFANLRQIYSALVLASWFKHALKNSLLDQIYVDKNKVAGVALDDTTENERIYQQYLEAFKKGAYEFIKEDLDPATNQLIPRKYYSGGFASKEIVGPGGVADLQQMPLGSSPVKSEGEDFVFDVQLIEIGPQANKVEFTKSITSTSSTSSSPIGLFDHLKTELRLQKIENLLSQANGRGIRERLLPFLTDPEPQVRLKAINGIIKTGGEKEWIQNQLSNHLFSGEDNADVLTAISDYIIQYGGEFGAEALMVPVINPRVDPAIRSAVIERLQTMATKNKELKDKIEALLIDRLNKEEKDSTVLVSIVWYFSEHTSEAGAAALIKLYPNLPISPIVREEIVDNLGKISQSQNTQDFLTRIAGGPFVPNMRVKALHSLNAIDPAKAATIAQAYLTETRLPSNPLLGEINRIAAQTASSPINETPGSAQKPSKRLEEILRMLDRPNTQKNPEDFLTFLTDADPAVRAVAARSIIIYAGDNNKIERWFNGLLLAGETDTTVLKFIMNYFGKIKSTIGAKTLITATFGNIKVYPDVRREIIATIEKIGDPETLPFLERVILEGPFLPEMRAQALKAIRTLDATQAARIEKELAKIDPAAAPLVLKELANLSNPPTIKSIDVKRTTLFAPLPIIMDSAPWQTAQNMVDSASQFLNGTPLHLIEFVAIGLSIIGLIQASKHAAKLQLNNLLAAAETTEKTLRAKAQQKILDTYDLVVGGMIFEKMDLGRLVNITADIFETAPLKDQARALTALTDTLQTILDEAYPVITRPESLKTDAYDGTGTLSEYYQIGPGRKIIARWINDIQRTEATLESVIQRLDQTFERGVVPDQIIKLISTYFEENPTPAAADFLKKHSTDGLTQKRIYIFEKFKEFRRDFQLAPHRRSLLPVFKTLVNDPSYTIDTGFDFELLFQPEVVTQHTASDGENAIVTITQIPVIDTNEPPQISLELRKLYEKYPPHPQLQIVSVLHHLYNGKHVEAEQTRNLLKYKENLTQKDVQQLFVLLSRLKDRHSEEYTDKFIGYTFKLLAEHNPRNTKVVLQAISASAVWIIDEIALNAILTTDDVRLIETILADQELLAEISNLEIVEKLNARKEELLRNQTASSPIVLISDLKRDIVGPELFYSRRSGLIRLDVNLNNKLIDEFAQLLNANESGLKKGINALVRLVAEMDGSLRLTIAVEKTDNQFLITVAPNSNQNQTFSQTSNILAEVSRHLSNGMSVDILGDVLEPLPVTYRISIPITASSPVTSDFRRLDDSETAALFAEYKTNRKAIPVAMSYVNGELMVHNFSDIQRLEKSDYPKNRVVPIQLGEQKLLATLRAYEQLTAEKFSDTDQSSTATKGGIDFNPEFLDLQIKRDGRGVPLPLDQQPVQWIERQIQGIVPVIINVTPATNLPLLLGSASPSDPEESPLIQDFLETPGRDPRDLLTSLAE